MKAWFVSDIHITGPEDTRLKLFESFLLARRDDGTTHLFLVGDIFDLWVGGGDYFVGRYSTAIDLIRDLRQRGVEVFYFEGNHDLHLEKMWAEKLNCRVFTGPAYFDLGPYRVRVEHGDQMNPEDTGYLFLRSVLRTPAVEWLTEKLPGAAIQAVGNRMSRTSRQWTSSSMKARDEDAIRKMVRAHAEKVFEDDEPFDLVISGHVHVRDDYKWKDPATNREVRSINLGWWPSRSAPSAEHPQVFCLDNQAGDWKTVAFN